MRTGSTPARCRPVSPPRLPCVLLQGPVCPRALSAACPATTGARGRGCGRRRASTPRGSRCAAQRRAGPALTVVVVPRQVLRVDEQVVVSVQLPELAVDHVEVLVGEELRQLVDVRLLLQERHVLARKPREACGSFGRPGDLARAGGGRRAGRDLLKGPAPRSGLPVGPVLAERMLHGWGCQHGQLSTLAHYPACTEPRCQR